MPFRDADRRYERTAFIVRKGSQAQKLDNGKVSFVDKAPEPPNIIMSFVLYYHDNNYLNNLNCPSVFHIFYRIQI